MEKNIEEIVLKAEVIGSCPFFLWEWRWGWRNVFPLNENTKAERFIVENSQGQSGWVLSTKEGESENQRC